MTGRSSVTVSPSRVSTRPEHAVSGRRAAGPCFDDQMLVARAGGGLDDFVPVSAAYVIDAALVVVTIGGVPVAVAPCALTLSRACHS